MCLQELINTVKYQVCRDGRDGWMEGWRQAGRQGGREQEREHAETESFSCVGFFLDTQGDTVFQFFGMTNPQRQVVAGTTHSGNLDESFGD